MPHSLGANFHSAWVSWVSCARAWFDLSTSGAGLWQEPSACSLQRGAGCGVTAQDCSQAVSLQLLAKDSAPFLPPSSLPFLAFCSHWVVGSIWLLSICVLDDKPGTSPLTELPLALSSHPVRFVSPGHNGSWGLSGRSDTEFSCCLHASCHRHKVEWALASIHLPTRRQSLLESLAAHQNTDCAPSVAAVWVQPAKAVLELSKQIV